MSDVYSDLNVKNGSKIVLGESGVAISSSGCVVLGDGSSKDLSDMATKSYVDSKLSNSTCYSGCEYLLFCPEDPHNCGTVAKLKANYQSTLLSTNNCYRLVLQSEQECVITHSGWGIHFGIGGTYLNPDVKFSLPEKDSGTYTLATTDDIPSGGTVSGDYLPATNEPLLGGNCSFYNVKDAVLFSKACVHLINPDVNKGVIYFDSVGDTSAKASFVEGGWTDNNSKCKSFLDLGACCVMFYSGNACFQFPEKPSAETPYTLATTEDITGLCGAEYLKLCCSSSSQTVDGPVCFNNLTINNPINLGSICFVHCCGRVFQLPNKQCGTYTLATTEDVGGSGCMSGCVYASCYLVYCACYGGVVGRLHYNGSNDVLSLDSCSKNIRIKTFSEGNVSVDSYRDVVINAGCSISFSSSYTDDAFCVYVPNRLPYSGCSEGSAYETATIVTSPGYSSSGCGLQICVLTQSEYSSMSQHGMTTLYFIKPENYS